MSKFTICLLKKSITSPKAAIDPEAQTDAHPLSATSGLNFSGTLYVGQQHEHAPDWVKLLNPYLQTQIARAYTANISAVLIVEYDQRLFAVCFGHGKSMLAASSWVRDFGLKVTLNRVDPTKLRSIDSKMYEDVVVSTRRQMSRGADVSNFELDIARDLVRGVTGDPTDTAHFKRLTGSDSITLVTDLDFQVFGDLLEELLVAYEDDKYKKNFGWIDNVREVDQAVKSKLDELVVDALKSGSTDGMHLAPADIVEWADIKGFNYTGGHKNKKIIYHELDLADYVDCLGQKKVDLSLDRFEQHRVRVMLDGTDEFENKWRVYDCLVWETELSGSKFVLFDGRWFEIDKTYAEQVAKYVKSVSSTAIALPDANANVAEGVYNESVAAADPDQFALLDCETVRPLLASSVIEFCDLMSVKGQFVHVKKRSSSATLSHLFAQGSVACDVFLQDSSVRKAVKAKLLKLKKKDHAALIPDLRPTPSEYGVVYAVLARNSLQWPPPLPFFSAVNLMHHASRIQNLGVKVCLQHVKIV